MAELAIEDARDLVDSCLIKAGLSSQDATTVSDHLVDCELRGLAFGGLARVLPVVDQLTRSAATRKPIAVVHETEVTARLDGGDQPGFVVGKHVTELAIAKARRLGAGIVGASNTWITGMLSYYLEMVTAAGFVGIASSSSKPTVAPRGGVQARFGTNPIAFGFPSVDGPVILDAGTSNTMYGDVLLHQRTETPLPEGMAYGPDGEPTCDPSNALAGALTVWGGHKGSGIAVAVQMLGMLAGAEYAPTGAADGGLFLVVIDPSTMDPEHAYAASVAQYADWLRATRPADPDDAVRAPFDRSRATRAKAQARGVIDISDSLLGALESIRDRE